MAMLPETIISEIVAALQETGDWPEPLRGINVIGWPVPGTANLLTMSFFENGVVQISVGNTYTLEGVDEIRPLIDALNCFRPIINGVTAAADIAEMFAKAMKKLRTGRILDQEAGFVPLSGKTASSKERVLEPFPARALPY